MALRLGALMSVMSTGRPEDPMTPEALLRALYMREQPFLQTNDWDNLRIAVADLIAAHPQVPPADIIAMLRTLRLQGKLMFLPDWKRWGLDEDESDGTIVPSDRQREPSPGNPDPPTWNARPVFMPHNLTHWFVRSRVAESGRLLFANRERFGLEAATAHLGYEQQPRFRPNREGRAVTDVVARFQAMVDGALFSRAANATALKDAIRIVGSGLGHSHIAAFQERAWESILRSLFSDPRDRDATMITAGVSSGKTFAFVLPILTLLAYRVLCNEGHVNRALVIYPRTSLVEDQFHSLKTLIAGVNAQLGAHRPGAALTDRAALDAGQMLTESLGLANASLAETLPQVGPSGFGIEIILTTAESLKNRMLDPRAVANYLRNVEVVVVDEIHLVEGLSGCHGIYFIRRLRQLLRSLRNDPHFEPAWVGASATVAEPLEHCARVLSIDTGRVVHVYPVPVSEEVRFGTFHHLFLHTRVGKPSISAVTNGIACLVHTRNDGTAFNHYVDPAAAVLEPRPTEDIPKTLAFVDSLSTIGRLNFTTSDNEATYKPHEQAPPYYSWFYRPAARLAATAGEVRSLGQRLTDVREWCQKCYHGVPARIDSSPLKAPEFAFIRTSLRMDDAARARATPPGFDRKLQQLPTTVGNLDECPFHEYRLCWWFSQDSGARRTIGSGALPIDQNRAIAYTSKTDEDVGLHQNVNDYFLTRARRVWARPSPPGIQDRDETVSTLLASPRIEVGVDFRNVRDGATHKAMRSAASFQQKIGRVGREHDSDSIIVTFLAHRPTDAHFAHRPARLIDAQHLDPIPLKSENPDVLRNHMFAAGLEFIASRPRNTIPAAGHELNIIGTGSSRVPEPWEDKVQACIGMVSANRTAVRSYMLAATRQSNAQTSIADEACDSILELLGLFVADLTGVFSAGRTAAHWFKENQPPVPTPAFLTILNSFDSLLDSLKRAAIGSPPSLQPAIDALLLQARAPVPNAGTLNAAAITLMTSTVTAMGAGLPPAVGGDILRAVADAQTIAGTLSSLTLTAPLTQLRRAHSVIRAFFEQSDPGLRIREQYYLHDILTRLLPFREFYPFGLVRTHFQHVNARQVRVCLPNGDEDYESLATALGELLPGTWNYRWVQPRKSRCGPIDVLAGTGEHFANLSNIEGPNRAAFEATGYALDAAELPADMPVVPLGASVPILRPTRLWLAISRNRPDARFDNQLIADEDEAGRVNDMALKRQCPTAPRAFPATWYRVSTGPNSRAVVGLGDPSHPTATLPHTLPAVGRVLFDEIRFSTELRTDRYVYAIDRSYGSGGIESPRIHYRRGSPPLPVVLGDTLAKTDGLTFSLKQATIDAILATAVDQPGPLRGELTIRALRRFIAQRSGCGPYRVEMIRKVLLADYLDSGGNLSQLEAARMQAVIRGMNQMRYSQIVQVLLDGQFAGVPLAEAATSRARQTGWYDEAWPAVVAVQTGSGFTAPFVREVAADILVHTLAVAVLDGVSCLIGAADGDLAYFHRADRNEIYVFDSVEGGNGCAETIERFLHIPWLRRITSARGGTSGTLPSVDGFVLIEEALAGCPSQSATRLLVETCHRGVVDPSHLRFPRGSVADLQARIRHEYDPVAGARAIVNELLTSQPGLFAGWHDLLWLQVVPERFAQALVTADICRNVESLRSRSHLCVTGCLECVDNGDQSVYGALASREHVSRNLLDLVRRYIVSSEPQAFLNIPAGTAVGGALQAQTGRPVTDPSGAPVTVVVEEDGKARQILLTQVRSTVALDFSITGGPLLNQSGPGPAWDVQIPFLAGYRDERPVP